MNSKKTMILALAAFAASSASLQAFDSSDESESTHLTPGQHRYYSAMDEEQNGLSYISSPNALTDPTQNSSSNTNMIPKPADASSSDQEQVTDDDILRKIRSAIKNDPSLSSDAKNLRVMVNYGSVTLSGTVNGKAEKAKVEQLAKKVAGVKAVANRVDVISSQ